MNRVDRLFALVLWLQQKRVVTAEELAAHFELSVRTVYRDLAALSEAGIPLVAEAGVGYSLVKGFSLPPIHFTPKEANALATVGLLVHQFSDPSLVAEMASALRKIKAALPMADRERLIRLEAQLAATAQPKRPAEAALAELQEALGQQRVLKFAYQGWNAAPSVRHVEPHALIYYLDRWHLIAWCREREGFRDFRTDRMREVQALPETFRRREGFTVEDYLRSMPKPELTARVHFPATQLDRARREWWQGIRSEAETAEGAILELAVVDWERVIGWLLSFGPTVAVLEPAELRLQLAATARALVAHHDSSPASPGS
ncbi:MAG: YafY family protein [Verrucomicrobiota bacterium JB022]|nr:YafY family protein [Verrucomicrobiota bacterium JB022]